MRASYSTRGNSCNKYACFFSLSASPSAVSLRPCEARLKLSRVLLWSHGVRLELDVVLLRLHVASLVPSPIYARDDRLQYAPGEEKSGYRAYCCEENRNVYAYIAP